MNKGLKDIWNDNKYFFIPYAFLLIICLAIKISFSKDQIFFAVNALHWPWADAIAQYVTDLGDGWTTVVLSIIFLLFSFRKTFLLASSYAITSLSAQGLKFIFDAPRPKLYFATQLYKIHFVPGTDQLSYHSFPSGHTVTAFSTSIVILYFLKEKKWGPVLLIIACCVGYSRMYLSQHFFEDVTVGSIYGFVVTIAWVYWIDSKKFLHSPAWGRGLLSRKEI